jgi:CheY-like chemotaxis protein
MDRGKRRTVRSSKARMERMDVPLLSAEAREPSVLVVEADPEVQVQMARALRRCGLRVVGTSSGDGALALVSEWEVDLVLVSEDLPGRAGVEVTRLIHRARPRAQVVVLASARESDVSEAARAAGAVGCVSKPFEIESLARWLDPFINPLPAPHAVAE